MDQKQIMKQVLDFNQRAFNNTFTALSTLQDETESFLTRFMEKSNFITPEGKRIVQQFTDAYRKGRNDFKALADENYRKAHEYFVPADKKQ
ncbi:MAG: hypothetical protein GX155_01560 [Smithella sp.]|jgi:hypothetical protein|nr:hypothetical protein [Smithella sp.]